MKGGRFLLLLIIGFLGFISYGEAVNSSSLHVCYTSNTYIGGHFGPKQEEPLFRECKVAAFYACLADGKKVVYTGYGCYDIFVQVCKEVNQDAREFFKKNDFKNKLIFNEGNVFAYICDDEFECAEKKKEDVTDHPDHDGFDEYVERVEKTRERAHTYCDDPKVKKTGAEDLTAYDSPSGAGNKLDNAFGLIGMMAIIFGWSFIQYRW